MTFSHWQRPHSFSVPDVTTDVLILGGGFVGLSTAYWLSELEPGLKITILERRQCGEGASGRNAGFLTKGSASFYRELHKKWGADQAKAIYDFADTSIQLLYQHVLRASPELKTEKTFSTTLLDTETNLESWKGDYSPSDFGFSWKEASELPAALQDKYSGGFDNESPEYKIHPVQLLATLRKNLESRKVQIIENVSGFELVPEGCLTEVHTIKCRQVILALNGYLPQFHPSFSQHVTAKRAQMLAVEFDGELNAPNLYYDSKNLVYWRKSADNILLVGGKRILDLEGEQGDFDRLSSVIQNGLEHYLKDHLGLKYKILHRWAGTMGFTESELPLIHKIQAPLETFVIGGFSGHGMGFGFHSAKEVAMMAIGQKSDSFFSPFAKEVPHL